MFIFQICSFRDNKLNQIPPETTWRAMNTCIEKYFNNTNAADKLLSSLFSNMRTFAKKNNLQIELEREFQKALEQKGELSTYTVFEYTFDDLPVYE